MRKFKCLAPKLGKSYIIDAKSHAAARLLAARRYCEEENKQFNLSYLAETYFTSSVAKMKKLGRKKLSRDVEGTEGKIENDMPELQ